MGKANCMTIVLHLYDKETEIPNAINKNRPRDKRTLRKRENKIGKKLE